MAKKKKGQKIKIDDTEYSIDELNEKAKSQLVSIQFVDNQLQQIRNELAVADTARIGYRNALKNELTKLQSSES